MTRSADHPQAWIVLGGVHLLNGSASLSDSDVVAIAPVKPVETAVPSNTIVLRWEELGPLELTATPVGAGRSATASVAAGELFWGLGLCDRVRRLIADVAGAEAARDSFVPVCYLRRCPDGSGVFVYSQVRFRGEDACFIRTTEHPAACGAIEALEWLPSAYALHAANSTFLNNHQCYYRKCFAGQELEYKYTVGGRVDVWALTADLYRRLRAGMLPGFVLEYRDEFQAWDYLNHLYEIVAPEAERGYVAFIPTTDQRHLVKRKWFTDDAFARREQHTYGVQLPSTMDRYVSDVLGVTGRRLPSFRRVRYDVNFESVRTGHVYGVYFDHCSVLDCPEETLHQCELEYIRSRTVLTPDEAEVLTEIETVAGWLEGFLREHGCTDQRGYYSKRSFLNDVVQRRPELRAAAQELMA